MFIKLHFPTVIDGFGKAASNQILDITAAAALPLIKSGAATRDDYLDAMKQKAREQGQNADWAEEPRFKNMRARGVVATANESFATKIAQAVKARSAIRAGTMATRTQHNEQSERERARYRKPTRRERTKSD